MGRGGGEAWGRWCGQLPVLAAAVLLVDALGLVDGVAQVGPSSGWGPLRRAHPPE